MRSVVPVPIRRAGRLLRFARLTLPAIIVVAGAWPPAALVAAGADPDASRGPTSVVLAEGPSLTLTASQTVILWGSQITLTAEFGSLGADRVILFQWSRDGMTFSDIQGVMADAAGRASTLFTPSDNRYYRAVFQGAADLAPHQSTSVRVVVRQWAPLRPYSHDRVVRAGSTLTVSTTVRPSRVDLPVPIVRYVLFKLVAGHWSLVRTQDVTADAAGVARWAVTFPGRASWYVRSMALPTPLNANSAWSQLNRYTSR